MQCKYTAFVSEYSANDSLSIPKVQKAIVTASYQSISNIYYVQKCNKNVFKVVVLVLALFWL